MGNNEYNKAKESLMKLYKFRPLANEEDFIRAKNIFETGEFYCSQFFKQNDPMEGVYRISQNAKQLIPVIFNEKREYKICSFSNEEAFHEPSMWGYYANGFRGMAIEIEVPEKSKDIKKIEYDASVLKIDNSDDIKIETLLRTKLASWTHEREYRYLNKIDNDYIKIGNISSVYFGNPYGNTINCTNIHERNKCLQCYDCYKNQLIEILNNKKIKCFHVRINENGKVEQEEIPIAENKR